MINENYLHSELTDKIIQCFYDVYNELGYGFLEKVYESALRIVLVNRGFTVEEQKPIKVFFHGENIGTYYADLVVDGLVILELKACEEINNNHVIQLQNYLKATDIEVGLLLNFGKTPSCTRRAFSNIRKKSNHNKS